MSNYCEQNVLFHSGVIFLYSFIISNVNCQSESAGNRTNFYMNQNTKTKTHLTNKTAHDFKQFPFLRQFYTFTRCEFGIRYFALE